MEKTKKKAHGGPKPLGVHEASLRCYSSNTILCLNYESSTYIFGKGFNKMYVKTDKENNRLFLVFNKVSGANVRAIGLNRNIAAIQNNMLLGEILSFFGISKDVYRLHITNNLSKSDDCYTVQVLKCTVSDDKRKPSVSVKDTTPSIDKLLVKKVPVTSPKVTPTIDIEQCIRILKENGYKIMKPVFVEI